MKNVWVNISNICWVAMFLSIGAMAIAAYSATESIPIIWFWIFGGSVILGMISSQILASMDEKEFHQNRPPTGGYASPVFVEHSPPPQLNHSYQQIPEILEEIEETYADGSRRKARRVLKGREAIEHGGNLQISHGNMKPRQVQNSNGDRQKRIGAGGNVRYLKQ